MNIQKNTSYDFINDQKICYQTILNKNPTDIFICADQDPNGTHKICFEILQNTFKNNITNQNTIPNTINIWLYKALGDTSIIMTQFLCLSRKKS